MRPGEWLSFLRDVADQTDPIAREHFRSAKLRFSEKLDRSPVTEADMAIEAEARVLVGLRHRGLGVLGEESGEETGDSDARLIIDPIDGTWNFLRGIPIFATLLAIEEQGEIVAGLVSAPALGTRWEAARGEGAWRDGARIHVSGVAALEEAQLFYSDPVPQATASDTIPMGPGALHAPLLDLQTRVRRSRGFGDFYQHVLVAEGAGEISIDPIVKAWDVAPLYIILEEAGGRATSLSGERAIDAGSLLCTNGLLHEAARAALTEARR